MIGRNDVSYNTRRCMRIVNQRRTYIAHVHIVYWVDKSGIGNAAVYILIVQCQLAGGIIGCADNS